MSYDNLQGKFVNISGYKSTIHSFMLVHIEWRTIHWWVWPMAIFEDAHCVSLKKKKNFNNVYNSHTYMPNRAPLIYEKRYEFKPPSQ